MTLEVQFQAIFELILACLLSAIIGLDREHKKRPAGLRTHILVGLGSCLFTIISLNAFAASETARVAANIVVGIGFLGGGVIIHRQSDQPGDLTTAASIWVTAAIGMATGVGAWFLAICAAVMTWVILAVILRMENRNK